jgi:hypothetical protein
MMKPYELHFIVEEIGNTLRGLEVILRHPNEPTALEQERQLRNELSKLYRRYYEATGQEYENSNSKSERR